MRIVLDLTPDQAAALHDLVVDADLHRGRVVYPVTLPDGLHDAVAEPLLAAIVPGRYTIPRDMSGSSLVRVEHIPAEDVEDAARALEVMS